MKLKKYFMFLAIVLAGICLFNFSSTVDAVTISDDGEYALILGLSEDDFYTGDIDGESVKLIKFNVDEGETTVKLSEFTNGIVPFNGKNEFSHWVTTQNKKVANEELNIEKDFPKNEGTIWTTKEESYTNGLSLEAAFEGKSLKETGNYYLYFDAFGGKINGRSKIAVENKASNFNAADLTKYVPTRKGYTFKGWDLDGKFVTSINSSAFSNDVAINLTATYIKNDFDGNDRVIILDANGGTIDDGQASKKYDYLGGGNSGTSMSLLPYVPVRQGYTFNGWNSKKDGSGDRFKYIYWRLWDRDWPETEELTRDGVYINYEGKAVDGIYKNLTLYASWTRNWGEPVGTVKEIQSTGETKAIIEFADGISADYELDVTPVEIPENLANKNVKYIVDINLLEDGQVVRISDTKMKIRIALPEDLKGFNKYEVVYISDGEIQETIPATIEDGYIVFETSHLSQYGIVAKNVEEEAEEDKITTSNPKTGDTSNILVWASLIATSALTMFGITVYAKKKKSIA